MTDKPNILIHSAWYKPAMDVLDERYTTHHLYKAADPAAMLAEIGPSIDAIGTMHACPASLMDACPNAKIICNFGVGYDGVDIPTATSRGIKVTNTPDVLNDCVADLVLGLLIAGRRHIPQSERYARAGRWAAEGIYRYTPKVHHSKVGIVGLGRIGMEIAARCAAFKMEIGYHKRTERKDVAYRFYPDLVEMARESEILIIITPGGDETRDLVNAEVMEALGPDGLLVNVARGSVVNTEALVASLKSGKLGAAALDVFPDEPNIPAELVAMTENVILTPHIASASDATRMGMGMVIVDNLAAHFGGKPLLTPVN